MQLQDGNDISRAWISVSQNEQILVAQVAICIEYKYKDRKLIVEIQIGCNVTKLVGIYFLEQ